MCQFNKPFIDFYRHYSISPVSQDITDIDKHFERRIALYRLCGIPQALIEGKCILEFGPGTGHNALVSNAMNPKEYVLVDGNPTSITKTTTLLNKYFTDTSNCKIIESNIESYSSDKKFDLVLCEGTIPFQNDPKTFLKDVSQFVKPGSILLITCVDSVSYLSEILRRILSKLILKNDDHIPIKNKLEILRPVFTKHLGTLKGMSRPVDDWIYDNILQPIIGQPLSIEDAVSCLETDFDVYGSSPHFFTDWRWYKDIYGEQKQYNALAINLYKKNIHNLLDYKWISEPIDSKTGENIANICNTVLETALEMDIEGVHRESVNALIVELTQLASITSGLKIKTTKSITEFINILNEFLLNESVCLDRLIEFPSWFGRGQQYVSFIRHNDLTQRIKRKI